jgi:hypothetical protein
MERHTALKLFSVVGFRRSFFFKTNVFVLNVLSVVEDEFEGS